MKFLTFFSITIFLSSLIAIDGIKVLAVLPFADKSRWVIGNAIVKSLIEAGNEATVVSPYPLTDTNRNYQTIDISSLLKDERFDITFTRKSRVSEMFKRYHEGSELVENLMSHPNVLDLIKSDETFDVCYMESFYADALLGIFERFNCIYMPFLSTPDAHLLDELTSNFSPPSYVPLAYLPFSERMNFFERWTNTLYRFLEKILYHVYYLPVQRALYYRFFPKAKRSLDTMIKSHSIVFVNSHVSVTGGRPSLQNIIEIGGIEAEQRKQLPADMKSMLDFADKGVIVMSLGSSIYSYMLPEQKRETFVKAFSKVEQSVIWKYENETLPNKPKNVLTSEWLPQQDILAHHNAKLLITLGSHLSISEALSHGVPILAIPVHNDHLFNAANIVYRECGLMLSFDVLNENSLLEAINEIFTDKKYKQNAEQISERYSDRTIIPSQAVVYWTEFVMRQNGGRYLKSAGLNLSFWQYHSLDVYLLLFLMITAPGFIGFAMFLLIRRKVAANIKIKTKKQ